MGPVTALALSADGRWTLSGNEDKPAGLLTLEWDYAFPKSQDWDEDALPYLRTFLVQHTPATVSGAREELGRPAWDEEEAWQALQ